MISQTTEYALRVVTHLAALKGVPATTRQIAQCTGVPVGYLAKVLQNLSRVGMIRSQRGLHGGSVLARPPEELTIFEIVQSVDPLPRIRTCPLGLAGHGTNLCPLHRRLDQAMEQVELAFRSTSIADILAEPTSSTPLCEVPALANAASRETPAPLTVRKRKRPSRRSAPRR
jgi:Rrf2 family transcriptional regulator, nitric oxide-sensitive transcriptional repressor